MAAFRYPYQWADMIEGLKRTVTDVGEGRAGPDDIMASARALAALLEDRDRALEDYLSSLQSGAGPVFDFNNPLIVQTSDFWPAPFGVAFANYAAKLVVAGATATAVAVLKNGASVGSFTIAGGATSAEGALKVSVVAGDGLQAQITSPGSGAAGLTVGLA